MLTIDGSSGEGGGQIIRSSLALSLITGTPFTIEHIRAGRKRPGLMPQHLVAVRAAARISDATVTGATKGSRHLEFTPQQVAPGEYSFAVPTAGSMTLVAQTILPALLIASAPSKLRFEGGTHNPWAPPFDFLAKVYLPLVNELGPRVSPVLNRAGFYPAGDGHFTMEIRPSRHLDQLELTQRGAVRQIRATALVANLPLHIAQREIETVMHEMDLNQSSTTIQEVKDASGPGNVVLIQIESERMTELFTGFGQKGKRAEKVAKDTVQEAQRYLAAGVPVSEYLADQLLLPLGIGAHQRTGGGVFHTLELSRHTTTQIAILHKFLDVEIVTQKLGHDQWVVSVDGVA